MEDTAPALTKYEIAAVTACVPCTQDEHLNKIISMSLRLKIATELMAARRVNGVTQDRQNVAKGALADAEALIKEFASAEKATS